VENVSLRQQLDSKFGLENVVGQSAAMNEVLEVVRQVAPTRATVLLEGESGTGKELIAKVVHQLSPRAQQPMVTVHCAALSPTLLESELFGHEKGAFTGALSTRLGRFEFAEGGTLFLDEIGDMSLQMQVKLLRVLQERTFERVGSNRTIDCNVRIIAATHRDLDAAIIAGRFREDLYYRLNVFPVQMPPLRDRLEDLPVLIEHLVQRQGHSAGRRIRLDKGAMNCLARNPWPGNVRELSNLLERLAILYPEQTVSAGDLPERYRNIGAVGWFGGGVQVAPVAAPALFDQLLHAGNATVMDAGGNDAGDEDTGNDRADGEVEDTLEGGAEEVIVLETTQAQGVELPRGGIDLKDHLSNIEIGLIRRALVEADGTVAEAARLLHIRRTTLVEKLRKYRLSA
jgi:sigma-54 dependent transcriptional regulator, flagellar regulatory protein